MAFIKPMALIESMSKKVCEHSDVYFRTNKKTGKVTTGKLCYPSTKEPSAAQIKAKARFAKVSAAVRTILAGTSEQKTQLEAEYKVRLRDAQAERELRRERRSDQRLIHGVFNN